ncbi:MAG: hypothetical protein ACRDVM_01660 [Acidimicrobiia bacterium]
MSAFAIHLMELTWWWGLGDRRVTDSDALELGWLLMGRRPRAHAA